MTDKPIVSYFADAETDDPTRFEIVLSYLNPERKTRYLTMPRSEKRNSKVVRQMLDDRGALLPDDTGKADDLIEEALASPAKTKLRLTDRCGWFNPQVFVLPYDTFGKSSPRVYHREYVEMHGHLDRPRGDLNQWKAGVQPFCAGSSYATFAVGLAFAGPLLPFLRQGTGLAFNLSGDSGAGKTSVLEVAQSVVGKAISDGVNDGRTRNGVGTLDITLTALEELGYARNDGFLPLDEFGSADLSPAQKRSLVKAVSFKLRDGHGRRRSKAGAAVVGQSGLSWRVAVLTSSEEALATMGDRARGETARFIDISVPTRKDKGVLDRLDIPEMSEVSAMFEATRAAIETNYGVAYKAFLHELIKHPKRFKKKAVRRCKEFVTAVSSSEYESVQSRYAEAFGKVYAALCAAVELEVVPFDREHAKSCVLEMYRRSELQTIQVPAVHDQLKKLAGVLTDKDQCPDWIKGGPQPAAETWAVRCENGGQPEFYIEPKKFERSWGKAETKAIEAHLLTNGVQLRDPAGKSRRQPPGKPFASIENKRPRVIVLDAGKFTDMIAGFS